METTILDLPEEILEKIFLESAAFSWHDSVVDLTLVCKKFNNVIGSSTKLMEYFNIFWKGSKLNDIETLLASQRKFQNISMRKVFSLDDSLLQFFLIHHSTLTSILMSKCTLSTAEFGLILKVTGENLEVISLCNVNIILDSEPKAVNLPKLNWLELMYSSETGYSNICEFFNDAIKVNHFNYEDDIEVNSDEARKYGKLIASLKGLKHLSISDNLARKIFADNYLADTSIFELDTLHVWMNSTVPSNIPFDDGVHYRYLQKFINSQQESLRVLNFARCSITTDLIYNILSMKNLKELFFFDCAFLVTRDSFIQNSSIETFSLNMEFEYDAEDSEMEEVICYILKNCINLRSISFRSVILPFEVSVNIINHMKNLEKMSFSCCFPYPATYPTVTSMSFNNFPFHINEDYDSIIQTIRLNRQLKHVKLPSRIQSHSKYAKAMSELQLEKIDFV